MHLVLKICLDRGVPTAPNAGEHTNDDETVAYMMEFFLTEYLRRAKGAHRSIQGASKKVPRKPRI